MQKGAKEPGGQKAYLAVETGLARVKVWVGKLCSGQALSLPAAVPKSKLTPVYSVSGLSITTCVGPQKRCRQEEPEFEFWLHKLACNSEDSFCEPVGFLIVLMLLMTQLATICKVFSRSFRIALITKIYPCVEECGDQGGSKS